MSDDVVEVSVCLTWMVEGGGEVGGFGGGWLEHPRQWLGARWAGLSLWECTPPRAVRPALRRHRRRAGVLPAEGSL